MANEALKSGLSCFICFRISIFLTQNMTSKYSSIPSGILFRILCLIGLFQIKFFFFSYHFWNSMKLSLFLVACILSSSLIVSLHIVDIIEIKELLFWNWSWSLYCNWFWFLFFNWIWFLFCNFIVRYIFRLHKVFHTWFECDSSLPLILEFRCTTINRLSTICWQIFIQILIILLMRLWDTI